LEILVDRSTGRKPTFDRMAGFAGTQSRMQKRRGWKELGVTCKNLISWNVVRMVCRLLPLATASTTLCEGRGDLSPDGGREESEERQCGSWE